MPLFSSSYRITFPGPHLLTESPSLDQVQACLQLGLCRAAPEYVSEHKAFSAAEVTAVHLHAEVLCSKNLNRDRVRVFLK